MVQYVFLHEGEVSNAASMHQQLSLLDITYPSLMDDDEMMIILLCSEECGDY
jgi:hypothetical protein